MTITTPTVNMASTIYFPHDIDATDDIKMQGFLSEYGASGYGIYWRISEVLHKEESHKIPLKKYAFLAIAKQMLTSAEEVEKMINSLINDYDLLISDGENFWSNRVFRNIDKINTISLKRKAAGHLGAIAKQTLANAQQNLANKNKSKRKKKVNEDSSADADFENKSVFKLFLEEYNLFIQDKTGAEEKFSVAGRVGLKAIVNYLVASVKKKNESMSITETEDEIEKRALDGWLYILKNFDKWDTFHQKQLKLEQINSNITNILSAIKNGTGTKQGSAKTGNQIIAEQLAAKHGSVNGNSQQHTA